MNFEVNNQNAPVTQTGFKIFNIKTYAITLAILIAISYPGVVSLVATFKHRDYSCFGYPLALYNQDCFWRGEIPLWNQLNDCGVPYLAQWNTMFLYPPSLFYMLLPMPWSLGIFCLLHMLLGGIGMYALARKWTGNDFAAAVAGTAYAFSGLVQYSLMWPAIISAFGWMPWVVYSADRAIISGAKFTAIAVIIGALQMLSGGAEIILQTWIIIGFITLTRFASIFIKKESILNSSKLQNFNINLTIKDIFPMVSRLLLVIIAIALLSAVQLLPFIDLLQNSHRNFSGWVKSTSTWAMPGWGFANLVFPLFGQKPIADNVFHQIDQYWTGSYYSGIFIFLLVIYALIRVRYYIVYSLGFVCLLAFLMALGEDGILYKIFQQVLPFANTIRFPVKFVTIPTFLFPLMAGYAVIKLMDAEEFRNKKNILINLSIVILLILCCLVWISIKYPITIKIFDDRVIDINKILLINGITRLGFLLITLLFLLKFLNLGNLFKSRLFGFIVIALICAELNSHSPGINPTVPHIVYKRNLSLIKKPELSGNGLHRVAISPVVKDMFDHFVFETNNFYEVVWRRQAIFPNCNLIDNISTIGGFYPLLPQWYGAIITKVYSMTNNYPEWLFDFMSVAYITSDKKLITFEKRPNAFPIITTGQHPIFTEPITAYEALIKLNFDLSKWVFLPIEAEKQTKARKSPDAVISNVKYTSHLVEFTVSAKEPAWVVLSQTYYHLWRAFVDDKPTKLWVANAAFTAVEIPEGKHNVKLVYDDPGFRFGLICAWMMSLTLALCLAVMGFFSDKHKFNSKISVKLNPGNP